MLKPSITGIFPIPIFAQRRDSNLDSTEEKEIEDVINEGMRRNENNSGSINTYIFDTKLKKLKEFCEQQIKIYVKEVITPKEEFDFYITQSWLSVTKPGENHHQHWHPNSIISGVFYVKTEKTDKINFLDPNHRVKYLMRIESESSNPSPYNVDGIFFEVSDNVLIMFPSWMEHNVNPNPDATTDRISLGFNTFAKGIFGKRSDISELFL